MPQYFSYLTPSSPRFPGPNNDLEVVLIEVSCSSYAHRIMIEAGARGGSGAGLIYVLHPALHCVSLLRSRDRLPRAEAAIPEHRRPESVGLVQSRQSAASFLSKVVYPSRLVHAPHSMANQGHASVIPYVCPKMAPLFRLHRISSRVQILRRAGVGLPY